MSKQMTVKAAATATFWAENARVQREVLQEIAERRAAGVTPVVAIGITPYTGPWAAVAKEEVGGLGPARATRGLTQTLGGKKRAAAELKGGD